MTDANTIFHISTQEDIAALDQDGVYRCSSLESEGFIHCCDKQQLEGVVQRYYKGIDDLKLLLIDPGRLEARLVHENTVGGEELFPHVYGPINADAILDTLDFGLDSSARRELAR